jgi:protein SCO1/2
MTPRARTTIAAGCGAALLAFPAISSASFYGKHTGPLPNVNGKKLGPISESDIDIVENLGERVPRNLTFIDGHGLGVSLSDMLGRGKPVLVTLGYYRCPMLCNLVHEGLVKAIKASGLTLGKDLLGFSVSIDAKEDPRSANSNQGRLLRALDHEQGRDWPFVMMAMKAGVPTPFVDGPERNTPAPDAVDASRDPSSVEALATAVGFRYKFDPQSKQFAHAAVAFLLTPEGTVARYLYGVDFSARDFRMAVVEASGGRVGTSLDRVLQFCFKYDPMTQRYTPFAWAFVRIGAGLSCLALFGLLAVLWRRELLMRRRRLA